MFRNQGVPAKQAEAESEVAHQAGAPKVEEKQGEQIQPYCAVLIMKDVK